MLLSILPCIRQPHTTENYLALNGNGAKVERSALYKGLFQKKKNVDSVIQLP